MLEIHIVKINDEALKFDVKSGTLYKGEDKELEFNIPDPQFNIPDQCPVTYHFSLGVDCNMNCTFCNACDARKRQLTPLTTDLIDEAFETYGYPDTPVQIAGSGEPLMYKDTIKYIYETLKTHGKTQDALKTLIIPITNAMLLTEDFAKTEHCMQYAISTDGIADIQNKRRNNTFDIVDKNIKKLRELRDQEYDKDKRLSYELYSTISNSIGNDYIGIFNALNSYKPNKSTITLAHLPDSDPDAPSMEMFKGVNELIKHYLDGFHDFYVLKNRRFLQSMEDNNFVKHLLSALLYKRTRIHRCHLALQYTIDSEGSLYPCPGMMHHKELAMGEIGDKYAFEFLKEHEYKSHVDRLEKCKDCWIRYMCGGPCAVGSYVETGEMYNPSSKKCELLRANAEECIKVVYEYIHKQQVSSYIHRYVGLDKSLYER